MWSDVNSPFLEGLYFILLLRYHNCHFRLFHPFQLTLHLLHFLLPWILLNLLAQGFYLFLPILLYIVIHSDASNLVEANHHRLTACPQVAIMTHKVLCNNSKTLLCSKQMHLLGKLTFQFCLLWWVEVFLVQSGSNLGIDFRILQFLQLLPSILVI